MPRDLTPILNNTTMIDRSHVDSIIAILLAGTSLSVIGPLIAEWSAIIIGASFGAFISISLEPSSGWVTQLRNWVLAFGFSVIATPLTALLVVKMVSVTTDISSIDMLPPVAVVVAVFWKKILLAVPAMWAQFRGSK